MYDLSMRRGRHLGMMGICVQIVDIFVWVGANNDTNIKRLFGIVHGGRGFANSLIENNSQI